MGDSKAKIMKETEERKGDRKGRKNILPNLDPVYSQQ